LASGHHPSCTPQWQDWVECKGPRAVTAILWQHARHGSATTDLEYNRRTSFMLSQGLVRLWTGPAAAVWAGCCCCCRRCEHRSCYDRQGYRTVFVEYVEVLLAIPARVQCCYVFCCSATGPTPGAEKRSALELQHQMLEIITELLRRGAGCLPLALAAEPCP
jgi:hypothetical protein